jgi:hypothetical protein
MGQFQLVADPNSVNLAAVQALISNFNSHSGSSLFLNLTNRVGSENIFVTDNPNSTLFVPGNLARIAALGPELNGYTQAAVSPLTEYINFNAPSGKPALNILVHEIGHLKWPG